MGGGEGWGGSAVEGVRHRDAGCEEVGAHQRAHGGCDGAEVVAYYAVGFCVAQCVD